MAALLQNKTQDGEYAEYSLCAGGKNVEMRYKCLILVFLCSYLSLGETLHSDPTIATNVRAAVKYVGKLTEGQIQEMEEEPLEPSLSKLSLVVDALARRQGAPVPLKYPAPPFRTKEAKKKFIEKNPNEDLLPLFNLSKLSPKLHSAIKPLVEKEELTPIEVSRLLLLFQEGTATIPTELVDEFRDAIGVYAIRCYNTLIVKSGACHGPQRPLSEVHEEGK